MAQQQQRKEQEADKIRDIKLPIIKSYADLEQYLQQRTETRLNYEEEIGSLLNGDPTIQELKNVEAGLKTNRQQSISLCKVINKKIWKNITPEQYITAEIKADKIMEAFKALTNEVCNERKKRETLKRFTLDEINGATVIAPLATYGLLDIFSHNTPVINKSVAVIVLTAEVAHVVYKKNPSAWDKTRKEITTKKLDQFSEFKQKHENKLWFSVLYKAVKKGLQVGAAIRRKIQAIKKKHSNENTPK